MDSLPTEPPGKPTMEYCSAIIKNKIIPFAAIWLDLEVIIQSEVSQTDKYTKKSLMHKIQNVIQINLFPKYT